MIIGTKIAQKIERLVPIYLENVKSPGYDEKYKWTALIQFQKTFDIDAENFAGMLKDALSKTENLLLSMQYYPGKLIHRFALEYPEETRTAFRKLLDETIELESRIEAFKSFGKQKIEQLEPGRKLNHYQDDRAISVYLTLRYPEKYFIFKSKNLGIFVKKLGIQLPNPAVLIGYFNLANDLKEILVGDSQWKIYLDQNRHQELSLAADLNLFTQDFIWIISFDKSPTEDDETSLISLIKKIDNRPALEEHFTKAEFLVKTLQIPPDDPHFVFATPIGNKSLPVTLNQRYVYSTANDYVSLILPSSSKSILEGNENVINIGSYDALKGEKNPPLWIHLKESFTIASEIGKYWQVAAKKELKYGSKSGYLKNDNPAYRLAVFDNTYRKKIIQMAFETPTKELDGHVNESKKEVNIPMNLILFGPPGTGKTFQTINEAIKIVDPEFYTINKDKRDHLKKRFKELLITDWDKTTGQIVFCTFHQSFSYEDFVEGIKPLKPKEEDQFIKYDIVPGVFKNICTLSNDYEKSKQIQSNPLVSMTEFEFNKAIFYKLSLGDIQDPNDKEIYEYCIKNNCISIGFGEGGDFSGLSESAITEKCSKLKLGTYHAQALNSFIHYMKPGNYVVIGKGNKYVRALGKIKGPYKYESESPIRHKNFREVEWIFKDENIPVNEIYDRNLSQMTIYKLDKEAIKHDFFVKTPKLVLNFEKKQEKEEGKKFVLIIDEINRGNISSIFGELITLIEKDKRAGAKEELEVILPYSKEPFKVPANVHIIGTMNTADRSIEALDTALRRRFSFAEIAPDPELIRKEGKLAPSGMIGDIDVVKMLEVINFRIEKLIDKDHKIGHAYFLHIKKSNEALEGLFADKIIPLLEEYFFGDFGKIGLVLGESFVEKVNMNGFDFAPFPIYGEMVSDLKEKSVYRIKSKDQWNFVSIYQPKVS